MQNVTENFLRYIRINTQSDEESQTVPSTECQKDLAAVLYNELMETCAQNVFFDEKNCCVYAMIPANDNGRNKKTLGFLAHMDTSPETSGMNVNPRIIEKYDGNEIVLNKEQNIILSPEQFPELISYNGQSLIVTDGTTLLGADDKAGVAEIMTMVQYLTSHPEIKHGNIAVAFTPDEEIGKGTDHFDPERFGADYAYTVDGGGIGELEYENFNAASADVLISGINVHPGEAKNKMINASLIAMEYNNMLPVFERPEYTENYEGFIHLLQMSGTVESAQLSYIIRDHDMKKFEDKKAVMSQAAEFINHKYKADTLKININDSYYNMKDKIYPEYMFLVDNAAKCIKELGITPLIKPVRGGTDGSKLSFMGLPCPNLFTGGHNYHGRYEYICIQSMEKAVNLLVNLAQVSCM